MSEGQGREGLVINLLRSKIYESDIKPEELLQGDIQAILIFLRNTSFGTDYTITAIDPKTNEEFKTDVDLSTLKMRMKIMLLLRRNHFNYKLIYMQKRWHLIILV